MRDEDLPISKTKSIPARALEIRTARASGPGGQHVNKTESKVQLFLDVASLDFLDARARSKLVMLAGRNVDETGRVFVVAQDHRDQLRNIETAREKLRLLVVESLVVPKKRVATKPSRGAKQRRLDEKKHRSKTKQTRGRAIDD